MTSSRRIPLFIAIAFAVVAVGFLLVEVLGSPDKPRPSGGSGSRASSSSGGASGGERFTRDDDDDDDEGPSEPTLLLPVGGRVSDTARVPVEGVQVTFSGDDGDIAATTGRDGRYKIELAPGNYHVRAVGEDLVGAATEALDLKGGSAGGTVDLTVGRLATVTGRVKDTRGGSVAGVTVTFETLLRGGRVRSQDLDERGTAESRPDGAFSLRVAPGPVRLIAERGGVRARAFLDKVEPGSTRQADITMPLAAEVSGRVLGPDRRPAAQARVIFFSTGDSVEAASDADGRFAVQVPVGRASLQASAPGLAAAAPRAVEVPETGLRDLEIVLAAGKTIAGKVIDPDGAAVEGATVTARGRSPVGTREALTGSDGSFELTGLTDGAVEVVAKKPPYAAARLLAVVPPQQGLELVLQRTGAIVGVVRTASGEPLTDYTIRVDHFMDGTRRVAGSPNPTRRLAPDGRFELRGLHPGVYELVFAAGGLASVRKPGVEVSQMETAELEIVLDRGGTIEGHVVDAKNGTPLGGARVIVETSRPGGSTVTASDGRFSITDISPGRRSVTVSRPGYLGKTESGLQVTPGGRINVDVRLNAGDAATHKMAQPMELVGIGASLGKRGSDVEITGIVPDSPAESAGLAPGDVIISIDGRPTAPMAVEDAAEAIRGAPGTHVRLGISRTGQTFTRSIGRTSLRIPGGR